jgi:hypothetical protein
MILPNKRLILTLKTIISRKIGCRQVLHFICSHIFQGTVSDIPFRISMEELCTFVLHRWHICCETWYNYIIFCPTGYVTILFHVCCTRPHILYILSVIVDIWILWIDKVGIMNDSFMCVIYAVHFKIANLGRYSIGLPKNELSV